MPENQIINQIMNDNALAREVMDHLLADKELVYETLEANKPLRQELLTDLMEHYCLSQAEFAEKTGAENARITRDVSNGILTPVHIFGDKKYCYTRVYWKVEVKHYTKYVEVNS